MLGGRRAGVERLRKSTAGLLLQCEPGPGGRPGQPCPLASAGMPTTSQGRRHPQESRPPVSVVLPAFNLSHKIARTLDALLAHDYPSLEIIVVDDGSTDGMAEVVLRYPVVRLIRHPRNLGVSAARNTGIRAATHDLVYLLDADCQVLPGTVARLVDRLQQEPRIGVVSGSYLSDATKRNLANRLYDVAERFRDYLPGARNYLYTTVSNALLRKPVFEKVGGFGPSWRRIQDYEFTYRIHRAGYLVQHDPSIQVVHDNHRESLGSYFGHVFLVARYGTVFRLMHRPELPYSRYLVSSLPLFVLLSPLYFLLHTAKILAESWRIRRLRPLLAVLPFVIWSRLVYTLGSIAGCAAYNRCNHFDNPRNTPARIAGQNQS